jgi:hypothetical protein
MGEGLKPGTRAPAPRVSKPDAYEGLGTSVCTEIDPTAPRRANDNRVGGLTLATSLQVTPGVVKMTVLEHPVPACAGAPMTDATMAMTQPPVMSHRAVGCSFIV